ncbi:MAG TPA: hypothetical protein VMI47_03610 [Pseudolabrys sp.]|nr:hypothetical protein [Pseudolabrys sp.]
MKYALFLSAALGLAVVAAPAAQAFTLDNQSNTTSNGTARYTDPDEQFSGSASGSGATTLRQGNATFQFGAPQTFDQRYNPNRMFDPLARDR